MHTLHRKGEFKIYPGGRLWAFHQTVSWGILFIGPKWFSKSLALKSFTSKCRHLNEKYTIFWSVHFCSAHCKLVTTFLFERNGWSQKKCSFVQKDWDLHFPKWMYFYLNQSFTPTLLTTERNNSHSSLLFLKPLPFWMMFQHISISLFLVWSPLHTWVSLVCLGQYLRREGQ